MKILVLIIQKKWFDKIMSGEKKQEFRECRPTTYKKYGECDKEGFSIMDKDGKFIPKKYDAIQFYVGYAKDRERALVEVTSAEIEVFTDDNGEIIVYDYYGRDFWAAQVVYNLGKIISHGIGKE